ncbi:thiamine pyrophosphate protein central region [Caldivirga maquilingensis IC-167]|uniref:2-oxoacid oxidoreductase (ferredoxin) n=1 Tax=Caldivirga maquilingensis (strain ATCC 700844 / DSM 13496 / JCM 10307 / IC-167) TaxID=397948 RepID=A8MDG0_CALMQ|nr:thiamine pyrophosphate protein central region [Caldivirga maquilingensis IC-167]
MRDLVSEWLINNVGNYVFTVAAENILGLLRSLINRGGFIINSKFEPSAGFMALVSSRLLLKPSTLIVTAGPGIFGALSPIAEAFIEGDPLIVIATSIIGGKGTRMHQIRDDTQLNTLSNVVKASLRVSNPSNVTEVLTKAYRIATSGKPGPVYIDIPSDLMDLDTTGERKDVNPVTGETVAINNDAVKEAANLLSNAELPVLLLGRGVILSGAKDLAIKLAELLNAPITTTIMAKGLISPNHPLYAGVAAGKAGNMTAYEIIKKADVVLAIGNRFSEIGTGRYSLEIRGKLIHVNIDEYDLGRAYEPYLRIRADAKEFLLMLINVLKGMSIRRRGGVINELRELWSIENRELNSYYEKATGLIKPWEVIRAVRDVFNKGGSIFIGDVGAHRIESFLMPINENEHYVTSTSYVSMGLAVPGAVAASIIYRDRDVVALVGDGGFLMTGLEVATAVQYGVKPKIIVFNDSAYRVLRIYEKVRFSNATESLIKLPSIDFNLLAESLGAEGLRITRREELRPLLNEALNSDKATIVDVHIDPNTIPIPYQRLYGLNTI